MKTTMSNEDIVVLTHKMLGHFTSLSFAGIKTIHIFLPISEKKEPDTFLFIDWLRLNHPEIDIIVPRADFDTSLMTHVVYEGTESLVKNIFNILEPQSGTLHTGDVDLVLIPMLAFDKRGYRVGYGKGFYDRFLQNIETNKIGLCLFEPTADIDDVNEFDVKLDACITPLGVHRF